MGSARNGICKQWDLQGMESARNGICKESNLQEMRSTRNGICKEWNMQGMGSARNRICKEWDLQGMGSARNGNLQNWYVQDHKQSDLQIMNFFKNKSPTFSCEVISATLTIGSMFWGSVICFCKVESYQSSTAVTALFTFSTSAASMWEYASSCVRKLSYLKEMNHINIICEVKFKAFSRVSRIFHPLSRL